MVVETDNGIYVNSEMKAYFSELAYRIKFNQRFWGPKESESPNHLSAFDSNAVSRGTTFLKSNDIL
jgi:hypothetical protein